MDDLRVFPKKTALITGISGQDGAYLARLLITKGYRVYGSSRKSDPSHFGSLKRLGIAGQVDLVSMTLADLQSTTATISSVRPDEIYHLAGQSSVSSSFEQPLEAIESIVIGTLNILEAVRSLNIPLKVYHASSSECFGSTGEHAADESTPFKPASPYGIAKSAAHSLVASYRNAYDMYAANGILFNHESELRPLRFVTQKIVQSAYRISRGSEEILRLGNLNIIRDWGWAPEYVEAMWRMLQSAQADDYVIATGEANSLKDFVDQTFASLNLDWKEHVQLDDRFIRPSEIATSKANPDKICTQLGWQATKKMKDVIRILIEMQDVGASRERI